MKRRISIAVVILALGVVLFPVSCAAKKEKAGLKTITIVDSAGRVVEVQKPVESIVIFNNSIAEVIRALGAKEKVVGIGKYMNPRYKASEEFFWPELHKRPSVGYCNEPNYEKIIMLRPQVVVSSASYGIGGEEMANKLEPAGIKVVLVDCGKVSDFAREIMLLGVMLGKEQKAKAYIDFLQSKIDVVKERVNKLRPEEKKRVYIEICKKYMTAGPGTGSHEMLQMAGGKNIFADIAFQFGEIEPEAILVRNPEVIIKHARGSAGAYIAADTKDMEEIRKEMMNRPGWAGLEAVKNDKLYLMRDILWGTRQIVGIYYIAKWLYPERFADIDPVSLDREWLEEWQGIPCQGVYVYPEK